MPDLGEYRRRRDPRRTPEPVPEDAALPRGDDDTFVVQEHHARRLHWDVRLERDGVLVSWAVPKGLPPEPGPTRLAVHTEDHPLAYATFAGEIPAGEYGGGRISIWDRGHYETLKWTSRTVDVVLHGQRARGRYVFFRSGGERDWMVRRMDAPTDPDWEPLPALVAPMLPVTGTLPPLDEDPEWAYEFRWEGRRVVTRIEGGRAEVDGEPPAPLRALAAAVGATQVQLDGVLVDGSAYLVTDLLHLDGRSCLGLPWERRRELLGELDLRGPAWQTPPSYAGGGSDVLRAAREQGVEGVLAKRLDSPYRPGRRSGDWVEITGVDVHDVVVGGWRPHRDDAALPGSLLVGEAAADGLRYLGAVSAGLGAPQRRALAGRLRRRARRTSPFAADGPADACWVTPSLTGEVLHDGWTGHGTLRRPRWRG